MPEPQIDRELHAIFAVIDQEKAAISTGDLSLYLSILADDAVFMPPSSLERTGSDLCQWLGEFLERVTVEYHSFVHGETVVAGDVAYHVFHCSWTAGQKFDPQPALLHFKGLHILRRQENGSWKIAREIWNLSPAP